MKAQRLSRLTGAVAASALLAMTGGCGGPIYVNSPSLQKATATAASSLPSQADALKPFDDQVANLVTFAGQENMAVAKYWTGVRDAHFVRLIAMDASTDRSTRLGVQIDRRLIELTGTSTVDTPVDSSPAIAKKASLESLASSQRRLYLLAPKADAKKDLSCNALKAEISVAQALADNASYDVVKTPLAQIATLCRSIDAQDVIVNQFANAKGAIGEAAKAAADVTADTSTDLSDRAKRLQAVIAEAEKSAKSNATVAQLDKFQADLKDILDTAKTGAQALGWTQAGNAIDKVLKGQLCGSSDVEAATRTQAGCDAVTPTTTTGRIAAAWGLTKALAQLSDANAPARQSANWLLAARASISAEQNDASLALEARKMAASAQLKRLGYLQREVLYLAAAKQSSLGARGGCFSDLPGGKTSPDPHCLFAAYVDSWNEGRIPAQVLDYQPIQIDRTYAVRRARAVSEKEYAYAAAGTATLKDYGAGGLTAAIAAQAAFDVAILAVGIGGL